MIRSLRQMRQTTTAEVRLDDGKAGFLPLGWIAQRFGCGTEAVAVEFGCGETSRE
jgi:hypothetical protein